MTPGLLVSFGATVASGARHSVLAGALAAGLVTGLPTSSNWMAVAWFAGLFMRDRFGGVPVVSLAAVVTVPASGVVSALETDTTAGSP